MGIEPPFLYDHPSRYSFTSPTDKGFQPKAASQASWAPHPSKPRHNGPLISAKELNRHPDSYFIVPYGQLNWKPLNRNTRSRVTRTRWIQLLLRICALLGSAGLLVCVIFIKGTDGTLGWIIRISPGIAILHTTYAIYHLLKSSKGRTPASSASYMLFAAIIDAGLLPFLVFTAMMSRAQYTEPVDTKGHWGTLFGADSDTFKIIYSTFLISVVTGGLLFISFCISIYLAVIFRKIAKLPPDMNPLEDNLTSRHKRNKSSISATTELTSRDSHLSAPLMASPRTVPFMHTRTDSSNSVSPTRRAAHSIRASRIDVAYQQAAAYQDAAAYEQAASQRASRVDFSQQTVRSPPQSSRTSTHQSFSPPHATSDPADINWTSYESRTPSPAHPGPPELQHLRANHITVPNFSQPTAKHNFQNRSPRPLEMNPPTPPIITQQQRTERALMPGSGNVVLYEDKQKRPQQMRGDSLGVVGDKSRYYGELHAAKGRVVSSGAKVNDRSGMRAREVSGKVVEEGRATMVY